MNGRRGMIIIQTLPGQQLGKSEKTRDGWSKKKWAGVIIAGIIVIIIVAGALAPGGREKTPTSGGSGETSTTDESKVQVDYEVTTKLSSAYLRVTVTGPEKAYDIHLSGPEKQTVGQGYIMESDMADGTEAADVSMTELLSERKNPKPGQYTLLIKQSFPEKTVFEATPEFEGPKISITGAQFGTSYDISGNIDEITITAKNTGGLPVFVDEMKVTAGGEESEVTLWDKGLPHGQTTQIETTTFITGFGRGTHPVTIEIYSGGTKLDSFETQVEF